MSWLRLCGYWFVMTAALGIYFPFFSLYLTEVLGFSGRQVGITYAVPPLVGMIAQPLWGYIADATGSRARVLTALSAGTAVGYGLLTLPRSFPGMLCCTAFLAFFVTAQMPMAVAVSLAAIERDGGRMPFGRVRVWGTLGFFVTVVCVPPGLRAVMRLSQRPERELFHLIFGLAALLAALASLITLGLPRARAPAHARLQPGDQRWLRTHTPYLRVLLVNFSAYFFLQGAMVLFPVFIRSRGGNTATVSYMWMFMLTVETVLMFSSAALHKRISAAHAIALGVFAWGARWALCAACDDLTWVYPLQMLHGLTVVTLQVSAALLVASYVPARLRASGQAGLNLFGSGLGGILSNTLSGFALDAYGIDTVLWVSGCAGMALGIAVPWLLPREPALPVAARAL